MELLLKRIQALAIDYLIVFIPSTLLVMLLNKTGVFNMIPTIPLIDGWITKESILFLFLIIYNFFMEYKYKKTIGKRIVRLKIVYQTKNAKNIFKRSFIKAFSITTFYGLLAIISSIMMIFMNPETSIHDILVRSKVCLKQVG